MGTVERFEDLVAWQKARALTRDVYEATRQGTFARDFGLAGQMQRAAVSIVSNIAEGFERGGSAEFHQFLAIAKGSCAELRVQLYVALDVGHLPEPEFRRLLIAAEEVGRIVGALWLAIERRKNGRRPPAASATHRSSLIAQHSLPGRHHDG